MILLQIDTNYNTIHKIKFLRKDVKITYFTHFSMLDFPDYLGKQDLCAG